MRFDVLDGAALELNVTGLQPDTKYSVQVAALTRKGDGDRSQPVNVKTPGGVPLRPTVNLKYVMHNQIFQVYFMIDVVHMRVYLSVCARTA